MVSSNDSDKGTEVLEQLDIDIEKKTRLDSSLIPCTKINSKWINNLNASQDHKMLRIIHRESFL